MNDLFTNVAVDLLSHIDLGVVGLYGILAYIVGVILLVDDLRRP